MFSKISFDYSLLYENKIRILLNDKIRNKFVILSVYCINNYWYIDIYNDNEPLIYGKLIHTWIDILEILKIYDKNFPKVKMMAIPSNINGITQDFLVSTAGIIQELFLIEEE